MIPARAPTLLPPNAAAFAENTWLYHGTIQGFETPNLLYTFLNSTSNAAYRVAGTSTPGAFSNLDTWVEFADQNTNVLRAPVVGDSFQRYYFFSPSVVPEYNTLANIQSKNHLSEDTSTGNHLAQANTSSNPAGTVVTFAAALDSAERGAAALQISDGTNIGGAHFNLALGTFTLYQTGAHAPTATMTPTGGGWYQCSVTWTTILTAVTNLKLFIEQSVGTQSYTGLGGDGIYFANTTYALNGGAAASTGTMTLTGTTTATNPAFLLGIPTPTTGPSVVVTGSDPSLPVTRSYVCTWVSAYGEECAPSPASLTSSSPLNTWTITLTPPGVGITANRNLAYVNLYRTVTNSSGGATFFLVTQLAIVTTSYVDSILDTAITGNVQLPSGGAVTGALWTPPPALQGCVSMPNGMFAGWANSKELWFCEPYRPHAWPAAYTLAVDYPIVGLGVFGTTLVIMTEGPPYAATGSSPSTMILTKIPIQAPCLSRNSIVSTPEGVYYASQSGLVLVGLYGASVVTTGLITRDDWAAFSPGTMMAAKWGNAYATFIQNGSLTGGIAIDGSTGPPPTIDGLGEGFPIYDGIHNSFVPYLNQGDNGLVIDGTSPNQTVTWVAFPHLVNNVLQDEFSGEYIILTATGVYQWDAPGTYLPMPWAWRSRIFQFPYRQQYVAAVVFFDVPSTVTIPVPQPGTRNMSQTQVFNPATQYLILKVYADDNLVLIREIQVSGELILFPSGFRANFWQFELDGQVWVKNMQVATSVKELMLV
jgi:hypothetical protein